MSPLTNEQVDRVTQALYDAWGTCYNCMPFEGGEPVWIVSHCELGEAIQVAFIDSKVANEIDYDPADYLDELIDELQLSCPGCGTAWDGQWVEVGEELAGPCTEITLKIPTINDEPYDFDKLFKLWAQVNDDFLDVTFDFSHCSFLRHNAVAFLGGLARLIEERHGKVTFDWSTLKNNWVRTNLAQNGFIEAFGGNSGSWTGNSIPYRGDLQQDKTPLVDYLKTKWLGRGWVHVSERLRDAIVGRVWEIYANAFEHGKSPIGIFSCGQYYPTHRELKLTVVDFGVGIPSNVRLYLKNEPRAQSLSAATCLKWAFKRGTTTKPNGTSRGMGLDLLKDFVKLNKGKLEVFSHEGYAIIDSNTEQFVNRTTFFEGTLVNITFICDESDYHIASEHVDEEPLF